MTDKEKLSAENIEQAAGGKGHSDFVYGTVTRTIHYLALRSAPAYDDANEIGKLHNGDVIQVNPKIKSSSYIWARALGKEGWVNGDYVSILY